MSQEQTAKIPCKQGENLILLAQWSHKPDQNVLGPGSLDQRAVIHVDQIIGGFSL